VCHCRLLTYVIYNSTTPGLSRICNSKSGPGRIWKKSNPVLAKFLQTTNPSVTKTTVTNTVHLTHRGNWWRHQWQCQITTLHHLCFSSHFTRQPILLPKPFSEPNHWHKWHGLSWSNHWMKQPPTLNNFIKLKFREQHWKQIILTDYHGLSQKHTINCKVQLTVKTSYDCLYLPQGTLYHEHWYISTRLLHLVQSTAWCTKRNNNTIKTRRSTNHHDTVQFSYINEPKF